MPDVRYGISPAHEITMPMNIAMPTDSPTRWPTPISAIEKLVDTPVALVPTLKFFAASAATSFIAASSANPAETSDPKMMTRRPLAFSTSPSLDPAPTFSTSAAATPSG